MIEYFTIIILSFYQIGKKQLADFLLIKETIYEEKYNCNRLSTEIENKRWLKISSCVYESAQKDFWILIH